MGKLRVLSGREVCKILERQGYSKGPRRGSHVVMQRHTNPRGASLDHPTLAVGTLRSIIRQSGLAREIFESDIHSLWR